MGQNSFELDTVGYSLREDVVSKRVIIPFSITQNTLSGLFSYYVALTSERAGDIKVSFSSKTMSSKVFRGTHYIYRSLLLFMNMAMLVKVLFGRFIPYDIDQ